MNGLLIFNNVNDIIHFKFNEELNQHIAKIGIESGIFYTNDVNVTGSAFRNTIVQIFSPLVTSQRIMSNQFDNNTYSSIECDDGLFIVFIQKWSYTFLGINHRSNTTLLAAQKKLNIYIEFIKMLCGTAINMMSDANFEAEGSPLPGPLINKLMDMWDELYKNEIMYLVEGVERLLINRNLSSTCVKLMENVLAKMRGATTIYEEVFCHSLLLVDTKLVALFSSRNAGELCKGDLLMLIALTKVLHLEDKLDSIDLIDASLPEVNQSVMETNFEEGSSVVEKVEEYESQSPFINVDHHHIGIFLRTKLGTSFGLIPHMLHSVKINQRMKLIVLAEISNWGQLCLHLNNSVEILFTLLNNPSDGSRCSHTKNMLDQSFQRITDAAKKLKIEGEQERFVKNVITKWDTLKKSGLNNYLQSTSKLVMTPKMEILTTAFCELLQETFEKLVMPTVKLKQAYRELAPESTMMLGQIEVMVKEKLGDYIDYLLVKANQNVTMSSYIQTFPGLLYYIYIDRNTGFAIAPSVGVECTQQCPEYMATVTKEKVWEMVEFGLTHLQKECLSLLWQDDSYYYSHFLWFEDLGGKPLKIKKMPSLRSYPLPGIICGDFYKKLMSECFVGTITTDKVQCYELFQIHVGVTTPPTILEHAKQLAASIWEISGVVHTPLDLL